MITKNIYEAKTELSKLLQKVSEGEKVIICRSGKPVASLSQYKPIKKSRKLGMWKNQVEISKDFNDTPKNIIDSFYND